MAVAVLAATCSGGFAQSPPAPEEIWASATNETDFTAEWSAVAEAAEYRLDASLSSNFLSAAAATNVIFRETMGTVMATTAIATYEANNGFDNDGYTMSSAGAAGAADVRLTSSSTNYFDPVGNAASGAANVYFTASGDRGFGIAGIDTRGYSELWLSFGYRKEVSSPLMTFDLQYSTNGGALWTAIAVSNLPATGTGVGWYMVSNLSLSAGAAGVSNLSLRWVKTGSTAGRLDDVLLRGKTAASNECLPGYSGRTVAGTSETVTGLTAGATCYFRACAVSATETGAYSAVAYVTTISNVPPSAPVFDELGAQSAVAGIEIVFTVGATGYPAPVLALESASAAGEHAFDPATGALSYTPAPEDEGTQTFAFTASNETGVATQTVDVAVYLPAAPEFAPLGAQSATSGMALAFTVVATGKPDPALSLQETTASSGSYSFAASTGGLTYVPPAADIGTNVFIFLASNCVGTATQAVEVAVARRTNGVPAQSLLISEYLEGTGNNKAIEIFNGTEAAVNLGSGGYGLRLFMNGATTATSIALSGILATGEVFVVAHADADAAILAQADLTGTTLSFNGNDVVALAQNGSLLDVVGTIGDAADFAKDVTLVRKSTVCEGNLTFTPTEWEVYGADTKSYLGSHTFTGGTGVRPAMQPIPAQSVQVGSNLDVTVSAAEPDGDEVSFACASAADAATWSLEPATGVFRFTPVLTQVGTVRFEFTATDKDGTSSPAAMTATVSAVAGTPGVSFGSLRLVGAEGEGGGLVLPVALTAAADATVQVAIAGTALPDEDFVCSATTLVFSAEGVLTQEMTFAVVDDLLPEGPESARLTLVPVAGAMAGTNAAAALFIRDNDAFSIVTANLSSGDGPVYEEYGTRILEALAPDVALIQEFLVPSGTTYRDWVDAHFGTNYEYFVESTAGDGGSALPGGIVSRWPLRAAGEWEDVHATTRDIVWATIDLPGSRDLHVVGGHFKTDAGYESNRVAEAQLVTNQVAEAGWTWTDYLLVGGDLNLQVRTEAVVRVLGNIVSDAHKPADQAGNQNTSINRNFPYDYLLPNGILEARHRSVNLYGCTFADGAVFDTRTAWTNGVPAPALATDSGAYRMEHMALAKVFEFDDRRVPPQAFAAAPGGETQIDVSWTGNSDGDAVIVAWNRNGQFSKPSGEAPAPGESFAGGTVLCRGAVSPQPHEGLDECGTYFYKAWSYSGTNYSEGVEASAETSAPDAPVSVWASETNGADFALAWNTNSRSSQFLLDVATDPDFQVSEDELGDYRVDLEGEGETKGTYDAGTVSLSGRVWSMTEAMIGIEASDWKNGLRSARLRGTPTSLMAMAEDLTNGLGRVTFLYRRFGTDGQVDWRVEYSPNGGASWTAVGADFRAPSNDVVQVFSNDVQATGAVRIRIRPVTGELANRRLNVDDLVLTTYPRASAGFFYVPGYSNRLVDGTAQVVTGLAANATYYFRLRTMDGPCVGAYSTTGAVTTRAAPTAQTIDFPPIADQRPTNVVVLSATASSGLPVDFAVIEGPASIGPGQELTFVGTGSVCVVASQAGNGDWSAAPEVTNCFLVYEPVPPPLPQIGGVVSSAADGVLSVVVDSQTGRTYMLQFATNLLEVPVSWWPADAKEGTGESLQLDDGEPQDDKRYYRVTIP